MGTGPNGAPLTTDDGMDRGIYMEWYKTGLGNSWIGWDNSSGNLVAAADVNFSGNNVVNVNAYGTFQAGNIYAQSAQIDATITGGNISTVGFVAATGNITGGNVNSNAQVVATGNITGGNLITGGLASITGNVTGGNLNTAGQVVATGNITGGNLNTPNLVSSATVIATGNVTGGNLNTAGQVVATGNVTGGNVSTGGQVSATGNVTGGNVSTGGQVTATGNVTGGNIITAGLGSFGTTVSVTGNITGGNVNSNAQVVATGNITGGNLNTGAQVVATGNVTGGNIITGGLGSFGTTVDATGNITGGNLNTGAQVVATGNVTGGNLNTAGQVVATGNITGGNLITAGSGTFGNITISDSNVNSTAGRITINSADADVDFAVDGDTSANVFYVDAGTGTVSFGSSTQTTNAIVAMNATNSFLMPVGNTAQRPATGVTGMLRFNSTTNGVEVYNASEWATVGTPSFTVISDEQFNGDGSNVAFTLSAATTTNSTIVSINGIVQIPTIAYSVGGVGSDVLTFTEAPQTGDIIDVRALTTTTEVVAISNSPGNAVVETNPTVGIVQVTGDLNPTANVTYNLGTASLRWKDLFLSGSSMTLGNIVMKNTSGNTVAFYGPDGTTPATIDSTNVDTTTITNGTSNVSVASSGGNVRFNIGGTSNVMVVQQSTVAITGDLSVSGNATLSGNILGDRVQNGTTSFDIQTASGNANITVGGTSNVAVFSTAGADISGTLGVTGNITGGNLSVGTGTITVNNIVNGGSNGAGNIGSATTYFNTVFAKATSAQYADLAENYVSDAEYAPGTVLSFGGDNEVTLSTTAGDRRIAGVVSTNPSYIMNSVLEAEHVATIALTGRVPTFVSGVIEKGDMMVSAGNGRAIACAAPTIGTVIGKALENHAGGDGVIEVVVGRL
jgi:filamentous hemagglutinin